MHVERIDGWSAMDAAAALRDRPGMAWLDGEASSSADGGASYVASDPVSTHRATYADHDPMRVLRALLPVTEGVGASESVDPRVRVPRFIGHIAYDAAWSPPTRTPPRIARDPNACVLWFGRYDAVACFEEGGQRAWIAADDEPAARRLAVRLDAGRGRPTPIARMSALYVDDPSLHVRAIEAALDHITRGDIYQVNLARRWTAQIDGEPLALFLAMRRASPVPLGAFLDAGDHAVLARTMERFLAWDRATRALSTRPIKGTIARAGDDDAEAKALVSDVKERAEHAMIVDLMRNDLGRVAEVGTVTVDAPMVVEPYAKLSHLVSTVRCTTRVEVTLEDIVRAAFPPGSVTGAPKVAAVEIIEALERHPRGAYTGCVGYVDRAGGAHFAVAIRTAEVRGGEVVYHAGGGLVEASRPEREVAETDLKARAFLDAVAALSHPGL